LLKSAELPAIRLYDLRHYAGFRTIPGGAFLDGRNPVDTEAERVRSWNCPA
jgi:hypothetical protein